MSEELRHAYAIEGLAQLGRLPKMERERIRDRILAYASSPLAPQHDVVKLVGVADTFRLRAGDWRVVFRIEDGTMKIMRISHRREVYR